jgi:hypothetical protein
MQYLPLTFPSWTYGLVPTLYRRSASKGSPDIRTLPGKMRCFGGSAGSKAKLTPVQSERGHLACILSKTLVADPSSHLRPEGTFPPSLGTWTHRFPVPQGSASQCTQGPLDGMGGAIRGVSLKRASIPASHAPLTACHPCKVGWRQGPPE